MVNKTIIPILLLLTIEGTVWQYSMFGNGALPFKLGYENGRVYSVGETHKVQIPESNATYINNYSLVWQCQEYSCGYLHSFFEVKIALEILMWSYIPMVFIFSMDKI